MLTITPYNQQSEQWNHLVNQSRNGTFMVNRAYMDYHADRFNDASIMIEKDQKIIALLPANRVHETIISHGGLTFGGLVLSPKVGASEVLEIFTQLNAYWHNQGIKKVIYKPVPHIYHRIPSEEDLFVLHRLGAKPIRVDLSTTIQQSQRLPLSKGRKHALGKAKKAGIEIRKSDDYAAFWAMLSANLESRHEAKPTHSLQEISLLASRFSNIQLTMAYIHNTPVAGVVMYDYGQVAHTQYIGLTDAARETGALDALLEHLISEVYVATPFFNFGISTCNNGQYFNEGLAAQKEMFGGRTTILQWLEWELA
jgi:hypothetical protein